MCLVGLAPKTIKWANSLARHELLPSALKAKAVSSYRLQSFIRELSRLHRNPCGYENRGGKKSPPPKKKKRKKKKRKKEKRKAL